MFPKTILDIGANIGKWTKEARKEWPMSAFHLVEANPGCEQALKATGEQFTIALLGSKVQESVPFYTLDDTSTGASIYRELTPWYAEIEPIYLPMTTLDVLFKDRTFEMVKIDAQGAELDILRGGERIRNAARYILLEVAITPYNAGAPIWNEVMDQMTEWGFPTHCVTEFHPSVNQKDVLFYRKESP